MVPGSWLVLLALTQIALSKNAGVEIKLTEKGLEYGRQLGMAALQQKLQSIKVPDISGTEHVSPIGKVRYSLTNIHIVNLGLPQSALGLVPGTGISLSISNAYINMHGNWRVKYLFVKDSGTFDLGIHGLSIATSISILSDETGRPIVNSVNCGVTVGSAAVKFHGGASWLYNLFREFVDKALRNTLQKQICPLVENAVSEINPHLKTLNVLAPVDKYAEIEYAMVSSPTVSKTSIDLSLKGEFYNIGHHQEPPFTPSPFSLPPDVNNMLYLGVSAFTAKSAGFVYNKAGVLRLYITDDMIPKSLPIRLNTRTFGAFVPEIAKRFPGLMMKMLVKTVKDPVLTFEPNNATLQAAGTVTAYAIQPNGTLSPLFILNMEASVSAKLYVISMKLAGAVTLNKMDITLGTSYVGDFQVKSLDSVLHLVLKVVVIPKVNVWLGNGVPLPSIGKMKLINTQVQVLKGYMRIGTNVQFTG